MHERTDSGSSSSSNVSRPETSSPPTNAILPQDMQQEIINSGGKINNDGSYVHGSKFESSWNNRNSEESVQEKATANATLYANAGVTNKEDYFKSDAFKAARARAVSRSR